MQKNIKKYKNKKNAKIFFKNAKFWKFSLINIKCKKNVKNPKNVKDVRKCKICFKTRENIKNAKKTLN